MGKTSKPLLIVALPPCDEWDELKRLEAQGHKIYRVPLREFMTTTAASKLLSPEFVNALIDADIILGGNCWRMTTLHSKYLPVAIKEARMLRYPSKEERQDVKLRQAADAEFAVDTGVQSELDPDDVELPGD